MLKLRLPIPRFLTAGELLMGKGSIAALRALGAARAALLISPSIAANSHLMERLRRCVGTLDLRVITLPSGEPTLESLRTAVAEVTDFRPDWLVAVGGGSVLDAAKLIWIFYEQPDADLERLARPFTLPDLRGKARLAALPTTAGTGSEVSSAAVLSLPGSQRKQAVVSHQLLPDLVILDPELLADVPARAMAAAGLDALAHAVESFVSRFKNPMADHFAISAAATLFEHLPSVINDRANLEGVLEVQLAATMAGWVQNLKVPGIGHAIAHQMGAFAVPHGVACGALLASSIKINSSDAATRASFDKLALRLGLHDADGLVSAVRSLADSVGIGKLGAEARGGVVALKKELPAITEGALADICATANPVLVTPELVELILNDAI